MQKETGHRSIYITSRRTKKGHTQQFADSVTSRTMCTVDLLSRNSVLRFAAHCCICLVVVGSPNSRPSPDLQPPLYSGQAAVSTFGRRELARRLLSHPLHTSPSKSSQDLAPIPSWSFPRNASDVNCKIHQFSEVCGLAFVEAQRSNCTRKWKVGFSTFDGTW